MGINRHLFNFLWYASRGRLGSTITIGRQQVDEDVAPHFVKPLSNIQAGVVYCELLLRETLGATSVDSIDIDPYESASLIHDFNLPIPRHLHERFDTVIDGGSLEHIYNIAQSFENCAQLVKLGGYIVHNLPFHNFALHGFYQFSPELFFELYSDKNGFTETEIFIADMNDFSIWYRFNPGPSDLLATLKTKRILSLLVKTRRAAHMGDKLCVYQKFYQHAWNHGSKNFEPKLRSEAPLKRYLKRFRLVRVFARRIKYRYWTDNLKALPNFEEFKVKQLILINEKFDFLNMFKK